jgi:signal transduction histidine kinase
MAAQLVDFLRTHHAALCAKSIEHLSQTDAGLTTRSDEALRREVTAILEALMAYWERGDEADVCAWATCQADLSVRKVRSPAEVVNRLDMLSQFLRARLEAHAKRRTTLLRQLRQLDEGVHVLRRCYLDAYFARTEQRLAQFDEYERIRQRSFELQVLYELSQQAGYTLDYNELVRLLLERLAHAMPHDVSASILMTDALCNLCLRPTRPLTATVQDEIQERLLQSFKRMSAKALELKPEHIRVHLLESDVFDATKAPITHLGSAFQVPLIVNRGHEVVGLLFIGAEHDVAFREEQVRLLYAVANQAVFSIQRLRTVFAESQQRLGSLLEHLPEGVLMLDAGMRLVVTNPMAKTYLAALTDTDIGEVLTHLGRCPVEELLRPLPAGLLHEVEVEGPPYRLFEVEARAAGSNPEATGWVLVLRDVTEERQVQERVQQQERLAAVGQLAAGIAHDFNNLLTGIIGFADLLHNRADIPEDARSKLARILTQGERGAHLVRQILDFSRTSISQLLPLDLVPFLKEATKFLERTIPENIRIALQMDPGEYVVHADLPQLQQVLTNLAVNAWGAMPMGGTLTLHLSHYTRKLGERPPCLGMPSGEWVVLSMCDTGTGIPSHVLPRIFEPFFTTKEPGRGTGLGLAQVYGIIKQHKGYIRAESQEGQGTTMVMYLPAVEQTPQVTHHQVPGEVPHGHGETILLVEDEPVVLEVCTITLEHLGYRVLSAINGQQALEVYAQHQDDIALVMMDMVMPVMGGEELFEALRAFNPAVKAVITTGYPLHEEGKQLLARGILAWLQKPFNQTQLAHTIHRVLHE